MSSDRLPGSKKISLSDDELSDLLAALEDAAEARSEEAKILVCTNHLELAESNRATVGRYEALSVSAAQLLRETVFRLGDTGARLAEQLHEPLGFVPLQLQSLALLAGILSVCGTEGVELNNELPAQRFECGDPTFDFSGV